MGRVDEALEIEELEEVERRYEGKPLEMLTVTETCGLLWSNFGFFDSRPTKGAVFAIYDRDGASGSRSCCSEQPDCTIAIE